jgi:hypothetical protein
LGGVKIPEDRCSGIRCENNQTGFKTFWRFQNVFKTKLGEWKCKTWGSWRRSWGGHGTKCAGLAHVSAGWGSCTTLKEGSMCTRVDKWRCGDAVYSKTFATKVFRGGFYLLCSFCWHAAHQHFLHSPLIIQCVSSLACAFKSPFGRIARHCLDT